MEKYLVFNMNQNLKLVVINDYNTKVSEIIKTLHVDTAKKIVFSINYLPEENKYRFIEFHIKNHHVDTSEYKYLDISESTIFKDFLSGNQNTIRNR